jgi:hypothetical protein
MLNFFMETQFASNTIAICYGWQQALHLSSKMLMGQTWAMAQVIANTLFLVVKHYI